MGNIYKKYELSEIETGFTDIQALIYGDYRNLCKADIAGDKKGRRKALKELNSHVLSQAECFFDLYLKDIYHNIVLSYTALSDSETNKVLSMENPDESTVNYAVMVGAASSRVSNLGLIYYEKDDMSGYNFDTEIARRSLNVLKGKIKEETDEKKIKVLKEMMYALLCASPALEREFLSNPDLLDVQYSQYDNSNRNKEYSRLQSDTIKSIIYDYIESILTLKGAQNSYTEYVILSYEIFIHAYYSFLKGADTYEIRTVAKKLIEEYVGKTPQSRIDEVLEILKSLTKNNGTSIVISIFGNTDGNQN